MGHAPPVVLTLLAALGGWSACFSFPSRSASDEDTLLELFLGRLDRMLALGTTLVEAKSGYGLETETELKMLRVITRAQTQHPVEIVSTFCGAHSVPKVGRRSRAWGVHRCYRAGSLVP